MKRKNIERCSSTSTFQPANYSGVLPPKFVIGISQSGKRTYCEQWAEKLLNRENTIVKIIDCYGNWNEFLPKEADKEVFLFVLNVTEKRKNVLNYNYPQNVHVTFTGETYLWEYICKHNLYTECEFIKTEFSLRETIRLIKEYNINYNEEQTRHFYHACLHLPSNMQRFFEFREEILALPQKEEKELDDHYYWRLTTEQRQLACKLRDIDFYEKDELGKIDAICKLIFLCPQHWWVGRQYDMVMAVLYSCALISVHEHPAEFFWGVNLSENKVLQFFKGEMRCGDIISSKEILDALLFLCGIGYLENIDGEYYLAPTMQYFFEEEMKNNVLYEYNWEEYVIRFIVYKVPYVEKANTYHMVKD